MSGASLDLPDLCQPLLRKDLQKTGLPRAQVMPWTEEPGPILSYRSHRQVLGSPMKGETVKGRRLWSSKAKRYTCQHEEASEKWMNHVCEVFVSQMENLRRGEMFTGALLQHISLLPEHFVFQGIITTRV